MSNGYQSPPWFSDQETANIAVIDDGAGGSGSNFTSDIVVAWWYDRVIERLEELRRLPENWDSYGAAQPSFKSARILGNALDLIARSFPGSDCPELFGSPAGGFTAEWTSPLGEFSIEVEPDAGPTAWLRPKDGESGFAEFSERNREPLLEAAKRFFA